jgi:hypothetical protein
MAVCSEVRENRTLVYGHGAPDTSDREMEVLGALYCAPDAEAWCVQCGTVLHLVIPSTVGACSDRWRSSVEVERAPDAGCLRLVVRTSASSGVEFGLVKEQWLYLTLGL